MKYRPASIIRLAVPSGTPQSTHRPGDADPGRVRHHPAGQGRNRAVREAAGRRGRFRGPDHELSMARPAATVADAIEGINELGRLRPRERPAARPERTRLLLHWQAAGLSCRMRTTVPDGSCCASCRSPGSSISAPAWWAIRAASSSSSIVVVAGARDGVAKGQAAVTRGRADRSRGRGGQPVGANPPDHRPQLAHPGDVRRNRGNGRSSRATTRPQCPRSRSCATDARVKQRRPDRDLGPWRDAAARAADRRRVGRRGRGDRRSEPFAELDRLEFVTHPRLRGTVAFGSASRRVRAARNREPRVMGDSG